MRLNHKPVPEIRSRDRHLLDVAVGGFAVCWIIGLRALAQLSDLRDDAVDSSLRVKYELDLSAA